MSAHTQENTRPDFFWTWRFPALYVGLALFSLLVSLFAGSDSIPLFDLEADDFLRGACGTLIGVALLPSIFKALDFGPRHSN